MDRILIVKTSALGDIIHAFPVTHYLKAKYPNSTLGWVVEKPFAALVEAHPLVDEVYPVETKKWRKELFSAPTRVAIVSLKRQLQKKPFDVLFDLQGNFKSGLITSLVKARHKIGFGLKSVPETLNLLFTNKRFNPKPHQNIRDDYLQIVQSYYNDFTTPFGHTTLLNLNPEEQQEKQKIFSTLSTAHKVMVCPGSAWENKKVDLQTLLAFLKKVQKEEGSHFYFLWGNPQEKKEAEQLLSHFPASGTLLDKFSLPLLQHLMNEMDLVVSMDSLPLHLAGTTQTKTFAFFGPSSAQKYNPVGGNHDYFQGLCPYGKTFSKRCPILRKCKTGACMRQKD